jgi:hypothetical protein
MTAQIINFPVKNARVAPAPPTNEEDVMAGVDSMKLIHVNETLMAVSQMLFERLYAAGFDFSEFKTEKELKYGSFLVETLNSLLCKYYDVYHPFQDLADKIFVRDENDEFTVVDELHMKFIDTTKSDT